MHVATLIISLSVLLIQLSAMRHSSQSKTPKTPNSKAERQERRYINDLPPHFRRDDPIFTGRPREDPAVSRVRPGCIEKGRGRSDERTFEIVSGSSGSSFSMSWDSEEEAAYQRDKLRARQRYDHMMRAGRRVNGI